MSYLGQRDPARLETAPIRILHVDDQPDLAGMTAEFLERESDVIEVVTETTAGDGLERLASERIDCVVSDYEMPGRDGLAFLENVRETHGDLPFILFTGKGSEEIASEAISAGVTDYLQKETGTNQYAVLANRVENAVQQHRSEQAVAATEEKLRQLAERTDDVLFMFDGDWEELLFVNSAYEEVLGGSIAELREDPESFVADVHPDDRETGEQAFERLLAGESVTVELRVLPDDGDGDYRWVHSEAKPVLDEDGTPSRITGVVRDVTERKTRVEELQARATAMEAATDGIAILDEDQTYAFMNESHAAIYGFDEPEELLGESWRACYDPSEIDRFESEILPHLAETGAWHGEMTVTTTDGRTVHQDLVLERLDDGRVVCVVRDISDLAEREQELEQYAAVVDSMADTAFVVGADGCLDFANETALAYADVSLADIEGVPVMDLTEQMAATEAGVDRFESALDAAMRGGTEGATGPVDTVEVEVDLALPTGTITAEFRVSPVRINGERKVVVTGRDVTERRRREETLRTLHDVTRELMDASDQQSVAERAVSTAVSVLEHPLGCVWLYDPDEDALYPAATSEGVSDVVGDVPTFERGEGLAWDVFETGEPAVYSDLASEPDRYNLDTPIASEILLPLGEYGVLAIGSCDRQEFADIDLALGRVLANTVEGVLGRADREARLRANQRQLERQNERLDEFASVVSHDLQNPLQVLSGSLELAERTGDSEYFERCHRAVDRMDRLITDVLTLAREGDESVAPEPVHLATLAEECWETVETDCATLTCRTDRVVEADRSRLRQLLENLFANAVEHGGDAVTVTVGDLGEGGFYVADDGPGVPPDERESVFDVGYSTMTDGTGFGLNIVSQVADAHGWDVAVTESDDDGARFEFVGLDAA